MSFLAPWMLLGGLAVAVPIVLHFFYKARYRPRPWAAMDFLRQAIEQTSRRLRFQEYILLALRCLCLVILAAAFARPTCSALNPGGRGESIDAVLVFDTSYSMGAQDGGGKTRMDRAKEAALAVIDNLPPNSTVQVYACSDRAALLGPHSPKNLDQAREVVTGVRLTGLAGDVLPALAEAHAALDRGAGTNKEVYLFTDLQKSGWDPQAAAVRAKADEIRRRATLVVVRCGSPERAVNNVAITDLTFPGGIPHTGSRLPVTVLVKNTGKNPVRKLSVTLEVDGRRDETESGEAEEVPPGQTVPVTLLTAKLTEPGPRLLTARVSTDDLPGDNQRDVLIPVREQVRVLIVDGRPDPRDPKQSAGHFVRNALLPVPANQVDEYFVRVTVVPVEEAGPGLLGVSDVVFLCDVPASGADRPGVPGLSPEFVERLGSFVREGGGLVIGSGDNVVPQRYNAVLGPAGAGLLPFALAEPATAPPERPFQPAPDSADPNSVLARFRDEPFRTVTADVEIARLVGVTEGPGGRVLMRLTDQRPWIASKTLGEGEVVFVGTSLDTTWTNWPARAGSYLSFLQFTLADLTSRTTRGVNRTAGEPLVWHPPEAPRGFDVLTPPVPPETSGRRVKLGKAQGGEGGEKLTVTVADTSVAGVYRVGLEGEDPPSGPRFAVAPDLRESANLDSLTDPEAEELLGFRPVLVLAGPEAAQTLAAERSKREWTIWLLLGLFAFAAVEGAWAWFCGKAW